MKKNKPTDPTNVTGLLARFLHSADPRADAGAVAVLLFRLGTRITAMVETCAHLGGPLGEGTIDGDNMVRPGHGLRYSLPMAGSRTALRCTRSRVSKRACRTGESR